MVTDTHFNSGSVSMATRKELTAVFGEAVALVGSSHAKFTCMWSIISCISPPWETTRMWEEGGGGGGVFVDWRYRQRMVPSHCTTQPQQDGMNNYYQQPQLN